MKRKLAIAGLVVLVIGLISAGLAVPAFAKGPQNNGAQSDSEQCVSLQKGSGTGQQSELDESNEECPKLRGQVKDMARQMDRMGKKMQQLGKLMERMGKQYVTGPRSDGDNSLVKVLSIGQGAFNGITLNGDEVSVQVSDETDYSDPFNPDAGFDSLVAGMVVRVNGDRDGGVVKADKIFFRPQDMHRIASRGTVVTVTETSLTIITANDKTLTYALTASTVVKFTTKGQENIQIGDRVVAQGWKKNFSAEPAVALNVLDFGQKTEITSSTSG